MRLTLSTIAEIKRTARQIIGKPVKELSVGIREGRCPLSGKQIETVNALLWIPENDLLDCVELTNKLTFPANVVGKAVLDLYIYGEDELEDTVYVHLTDGKVTAVNYTL